MKLCNILAMQIQQGIAQLREGTKGITLFGGLVLGRDFLLYTLRRFRKSDGTRLAAGLSYVSLLALIPLLAVGLAVLGGFPALHGAREQLLESIVLALPQEAAEEVSHRLRTFLSNASGMTGPGIAGLVIVAVLLLSNVNGAINRIFRVSHTRSFAIRLLVYWTVLTGGPLLVAISITISTDFSRFTQNLEVVPADSRDFLAEEFVPFLLRTFGLMFLYIITANRAVRWHHALSGAAVAAVLLEIITRGFGLYLAYFPSYQAIYGALATIPIFLLWMYLMLAAVLLGAEVAAALPEFRAVLAHQLFSSQSGTRLSLALSILDDLAEASRDGKTRSLRRLQRNLSAAPAEIDELVEKLRKGEFVVKTKGRVLLSRDLGAVSLRELMTAVGLDPMPGEGWPARAQALSQRANDQLAELIDRPLRELLEDAAGADSAETESPSRPRVIGRS